MWHINKVVAKKCHIYRMILFPVHMKNLINTGNRYLVLIEKWNVKVFLFLNFFLHNVGKNANEIWQFSSEYWNFVIICIIN